MGSYFYYKILLPYSVNEGNKIPIKTDFGIHYLKITKFIEKGEELKFKIFVKNTNNDNYDDENINPFTLSISNNSYLNRFYQYSGD